MKNDPEIIYLQKFCKELEERANALEEERAELEASVHALDQQNIALAIQLDSVRKTLKEADEKINYWKQQNYREFNMLKGEPNDEKG